VKRNLIKAVGITFIIFAILTWIIPTGTYVSGELETNSIDPISFFDLAAIPLSTIITFITYGVVFAVIGGLYGVMEKTGALTTFVKKVRGWFNGKEKLFLVLTILHFVILSSVTGLVIPLFALVPLFAAIMFEMGYKKLTALISTVGALLVGSIGSTYGFNISGYTKNIFALDMNDEIIVKLILLALITIALIIFVVKTAKREEVKPEIKAEKKEEAVKKVETKKETKSGSTKKTTAKKPANKKSGNAKKNTKKKSTAALAVAKEGKKVKMGKRVSVLPLVIIFSLMLIVTMVGMYNWYYSFEITWFNEIYDDIMAVEIKEFPIFQHLLSGISQMGYWGNAEFAAIMVMAAGLIAWIYRLSLNEFVESFLKGVKAWLPTALYATIASVILCVLYQGAYSGYGTIATTVLAKIFEIADGFNVIVAGIAGLVGSFFYNDLYYLLSEVYTFASGFDADVLPLAGLISQAIYSLAMLLLPTSVILIAGLSHFDVSYKQWIKYIWKFAIVLLVIILAVCGIASAI